MKTAPVTRRPCDRARSRAWTHWSTISQVARLRRVGIRAVAQKAQPIAQPTCDERQTLTAPGLCSGIRTVSTARPSCGQEPELLEAVARRGRRRGRASAGAGRRSRRRAAAGPGTTGPRPPGRGCPGRRIAVRSRRTARSVDPERRGRGQEGVGGLVAGVEHVAGFPGWTENVVDGRRIRLYSSAQRRGPSASPDAADAGATGPFAAGSCGDFDGPSQTFSRRSIVTRRSRDGPPIGPESRLGRGFDLRRDRP